MSLETIQNITLDFTVPRIKNVRCVESDENSRIIHITITNNGQPYPLDANTMLAKYKIHKPDQTYIYNSIPINSDGTVTIELSRQATSVSGLCPCELQISDITNSCILSTMPFQIIVEKSVLSNSDIISASESDVIRDMTHHLSNYDNPHRTTKAQVGLGNVDNTSDTDKPISKVQQAAFQNMNSVLNLLANNTYKNLLRNYASTKTINGITFTVNSNGTITVNGTATDDTTFMFGSYFFEDSTSHFVYTGTPATGSDDTYCTQLVHCKTNGYSNIYNEYGDGFTLVSDNGVFDFVNVQIKISSGYKADSLIFKPMIRLAAITDNTYVPYNTPPCAIGNLSTLTTSGNSSVVAAVNEVVNTVKEQDVLFKQTLGYTKKNLLKNGATSKTVSGVTFTINEDKSITVNGTATAQARFYFTTGLVFDFDTILTIDGCSNDGVSAWCSNANYFGGNKKISANTSYGEFFLYVNSGVTVTNVTVYPMIRSADISDGIYEPYMDDINVRLETLEEMDTINKSRSLVPYHSESYTGGNSYYKIATFTITSQWVSKWLYGKVYTTADTSGVARHLEFGVEVKQQLALGNAPACSVRVFNYAGITPDQLALVITTNTSEKTVAELWGKITINYAIHGHVFYSKNNDVAINTSMLLQAGLPEGTCKYGETVGTVALANRRVVHDCNNTDFNTLKSEGVYFGYMGMANAAVNNQICILEVLPYSADWIVQRQTVMRTTYPETFIRYYNGTNKVWSTWQRILSADRIANNLTTTTTGMVLDATQGKALNDKIVALLEQITNIEENMIVKIKQITLTATGSGGTSTIAKAYMYYPAINPNNEATVYVDVSSVYVTGSVAGANSTTCTVNVPHDLATTAINNATYKSSNAAYVKNATISYSSTGETITFARYNQASTDQTIYHLYYTYNINGTTDYKTKYESQ